MSTDIRAAQKAVRDFMRAAGQETRVIPGVPSNATAQRRVEMLTEEVRELAVAVAAGDIVEIADAIADIIYVALGAAEEAGIEIEQVLENVIDSNNSKIDWEHNRPWVTHPNGKVGKDEHYVAPNIGPILTRQMVTGARL